MNKQAEKAKADYMAGMKYKDIAEKYGVSINTVKSWQNYQKWTREDTTPNIWIAIATVSLGYEIPK